MWKKVKKIKAELETSEWEGNKWTTEGKKCVSDIAARGVSTNNCHSDGKQDYSQKPPSINASTVTLTLVTIRNHRLNPMHIRAEVSQFHLLALTCFDSQRICIHPLACGHLSRLVGIHEDVEHGRFVDDRQECHR